GGAAAISDSPPLREAHACTSSVAISGRLRWRVCCGAVSIFDLQIWNSLSDNYLPVWVRPVKEVGQRLRLGYDGFGGRSEQYSEGCLMGYDGSLACVPGVNGLRQRCCRGDAEVVVFGTVRVRMPVNIGLPDQYWSPKIRSECELSIDHEPNKERNHIEDRGGFVSTFPDCLVGGLNRWLGNNILSGSIPDLGTLKMLKDLCAMIKGWVKEIDEEDIGHVLDHETW
ncbi:hypothetical protein M8C21_020756, partial [Ambrosia artemisiifolia]